MQKHVWMCSEKTQKETIMAKGRQIVFESVLNVDVLHVIYNIETK